MISSIWGCIEENTAKKLSVSCGALCSVRENKCHETGRISQSTNLSAKSTPNFERDPD